MSGPCCRRDKNDPSSFRVRTDKHRFDLTASMGKGHRMKIAASQRATDHFPPSRSLEFVDGIPVQGFFQIELSFDISNRNIAFGGLQVQLEFDPTIVFIPVL